MAEFHFLHPHWLWLILPILLLGGWRLRRHDRHSNWQQVIEPQLLRHLLVSGSAQQRRWPMLLAVITGLLAVLALANPVWEKLPQSVYQTPRAMVIVLDLSASMNAADLKPNRLLRARLKVKDLLARDNEGLTGLVVFAGDAFSVSPLTRDNATIESQLRVLEPGIMPVQGSRVDLGLQQAGQLLQQAGIQKGDVLLITDGFDSAQAIIVSQQLHEAGHRVSVLGVGTAAGAPVSNGQGDVFRDASGVPVLARLDTAGLSQLAASGGGRFQAIRADTADLDELLDQLPLGRELAQDESGLTQQQWKQNGPYLVLLLLPLAALAFRRGWLFSLLPVVMLLQPPEAMAVDTETAQRQESDTWQSLWLTNEQRAHRALQQQQHEQALALSEDPALRGSALYRQQQYQQAAEQFAMLDNADANYNRGNALARMGQFEQAISAYDIALEQQPGMQHAIDNRAAVEELLRQQQAAQRNQANQEDQSDQDQQNSEQSEQQQQSDNANNQSQSDPSDNQDAQQDQQNDADSAAQQNPQTADSSADSQAGESANPTPDANSESEPNQDQQSQNQQPDESDQADNQQASQQANQQTGGNPFTDANRELAERQAQSEAEAEQDQQAARQQTAQPAAETGNENSDQPNRMSAEASPLEREEQLAAEQWLRRIPDDPGGLLKRKFRYQYQQRPRRPQPRQAW